MSIISVAIDGPSGAGKSTLAKMAAKQLGFVYIDTGAMYRTIALYCYRKGIAASDKEKIILLLPEIELDIVYNEDGTQMMLLNGENVSGLIRTPEISMYTSEISAIPEVRSFLLDKQRILAQTKSVIMDGRDIGTVVLPNASVKIFLTADPKVRAARRFAELQEKGIEIMFDEVLADVIERDYNDAHRAIAPLKQAEDAILLNTANMDLEQSLSALLKIIKEGRL